MRNNSYPQPPSAEPREESVRGGTSAAAGQSCSPQAGADQAAFCPECGRPVAGASNTPAALSSKDLPGSNSPEPASSPGSLDETEHRRSPKLPPAKEPSYRIACVGSSRPPHPVPQGSVISIGTAESCECRVSGDPYVSRQHARVVEANGFLFLEDSSTNGTFVRVTRPTQLFPGDEFLVGTTLFSVEA